MGVSAVFDSRRELIDVDMDGLLSRLLLFDKYILMSIRLKEFPILARYLGYEGLRDLLQARLIEVRCECFQAGQVGQSALFGDRVLPPLTYKFNYIDSTDRRQYVHDCLQNLHGGSELTKKQAIKLKGLVAMSINPLPQEAKQQMFPAFLEEVGSSSMFRRSVQMVLQDQFKGNEISFSLVVHREGDDTFRIESDLAERTKITEPEAHHIIEKALMGVHGFSQTLVEMKHYRALSGFRDEELPLLRHKFDALVETLTSHEKERNFQRVIDIAGLPKFSELGGKINIEKLLQIRNSSEAREFRDWLGGIGDSRDEDIRARVAGLRARAGLKVGGEAGKAMRFLVNTGIGIIPGASLAGIALATMDQFALDKLLPRSGIAAFVNELYPSIFERGA